MYFIYPCPRIFKNFVTLSVSCLVHVVVSVPLHYKGAPSYTQRLSLPWIGNFVGCNNHELTSRVWWQGLMLWSIEKTHMREKINMSLIYKKVACSPMSGAQFPNTIKLIMHCVRHSVPCICAFFPLQNMVIYFSCMQNRSGIDILTTVWTTSFCFMFPLQ